MTKPKFSKNHQEQPLETSSSEDEWEEVAENNNNETKKNVEIELDMPDTMKSKQTKKFEQAKEWITVLIKRAINKSIKEVQIRMHKTHLLCLLGLGIQLNHICSNEELQSLALSIIDTSFLKQPLFNNSKENVERIISHIKDKFTLKIVENHHLSNSVLCKRMCLEEAFSTCIIENEIDLILMFVLVLRAVGLSCRITMSLHPISLKPLTEKQKETKKKKVEAELEKARIKMKQMTKHVPNTYLQIPQLDGAADDIVSGKKKNLRRKSQVVEQKASFDNLEKSETKKRKCSLKNTTKRASRRSTASKQPQTISKYHFSGDDSSSPSNENIPSATKISAMVKMSDIQSNTNGEKRSSRICTVDLEKVNKEVYSSKTKSSSRIKNSTSSSKQKAKSDCAEFCESVKPPKQPKLLKQKDFFNEAKVVPEKKIPSTETKLRQRVTKKNYIDKMSDVDSNSDDADFDYDKEVFGKQPKKNPKRPSASTARKVSSDKRNSKSNLVRNQWIEVYIKKVGWVPVDCFSGLIVEPRQMEQNSKKPLHYVLAFDNDEYVKDVTVRYASDWLISTRKLRVNSVDQDWWKQTLNLFKTKNKKQDEEENKQLESNLLSQPLPTNVSAFKNHPLFALRRHLLKYEAIYPPDVPAVGFVKGEEVLPRSSVHVLHTREKWLQSALSVKSGETPFKMVASYLLNKKLNRDSDAPSLALFGKWQTEPYQPPVAENGKVPRNDYGNVDLFQPSMLPIGCVHLHLPSLNVVARKLNIDIATAVVGFDTHHGYPHPVTDGYVACKEYETVLKEAWEEEQAHAEEKAREKIEKRVYSHWKTFIRGLLALEKVRKKYSSQVESSKDISHSKPKPLAGDVAWQASKLKEAKKRLEQKSRRTRKKKDESLFPVEVETM